MILKAKGAGKIIVSEVVSGRKKFAKQFGAHHVLDPKEDDVVAKVHEICDGRGVNVAFDAAGVQAGLDQAISAVRARGTLVNVAVWEKPVSFHPNKLIFKELNYMGIVTYVEGDFQAVIDAIASGETLIQMETARRLTIEQEQLRPEAMITRLIKMNEIEEQGFKALIEDKDSHTKILVEVSP